MGQGGGEARAHPSAERHHAAADVDCATPAEPCGVQAIVSRLLDRADIARAAYSPNYLGIARIDDLVTVQMTANDTRETRQKVAFHGAVADALAASAGLRKEDVFINLVEVKKENWSFGNGVAQDA